MSAFDTMPTDDLERRLGAWMGAQGPDADLTPVYDTIVDATRGAGQRPWFLVRRGIRRTTPVSERRFAAERALAAGLVVLLIALVVVTGTLVASRLLHVAPSPRLPGVISPTGQLLPGEGDLVRPAIAALADGRILVAGGTNSGSRGGAWVYDPATGTYGHRLPMQVLRQDASATTLRDGRVLIAGGRPYRHDAPVPSAELFDPVSGTFAPTGSMAVARDGHAATLLHDGRVLLTGGTGTVGTLENGLDGGRTTPTIVEIYDPATGLFERSAAISEGRAGHTATLLPDGRVLVAGGYAIAGSTCPMQSTIEILDPASGTSAVIGHLATPRAQHTATLLPDGRVLIAGGIAGPAQSAECPDAPPFLASSELIDPSTGTSSATGALLTERAGHSATLLDDGRVFIAGGTNQFGSPRSAELYDPATGNFSATAPAGSEHLFGSAPKLADGRVFLAGANDGSEIYDPSRQSPASESSPAAPALGPDRAVAMTDQRTGHAAIRLRDGRVLIAGGAGGANNGRLPSAEVFDPATSTFSPVGPMAGPRQGDATYVGFVVMLLPDGRALVIGGSPGVESAEIFDPETGLFVPAPEFGDALGLGAPNPVEGLPDGRILLESFPDDATTAVTGLDAVTARPGPTGTVCTIEPGNELAQDAAGLPDGRVLILCGSRSPDIFDPRDGSTVGTDVVGDWSRAVPLPVGRILLAHSDATEGAEPAGFRPDAIFDPATGDIEPIATQATGGSMTALPDGRLLLVGGAANHPNSTVTLLDLSTGEVRDGGPLLTPRQEPSLTVLADGRVLIVGGATQSPDRTIPIPPGAELFDPNAIP